MTPIADAVAMITANPAPVVFLDSCILLDIVRAPLRNSAGEVRVAVQLLDAVGKAPKTVHLLIGSPTPIEWSENIGGAASDCTLALQCYNAVAETCANLALSGVPVLPVTAQGLPDLLRQLSADLLAAAVVLGHHASALGFAIDRVIASRLPAKKSGQGAKDSVILEHVLETTRQLRAAGFNGPCIFASSNRKDFAAPNSTLLHAVLLPDFTAVNLLYATSLIHAETLLQHAGWAP